MIPFRFGPPGQQLFGAFHPAQGVPASLSVLLCNPYGQEAIRIHRLYRVLADRLALAGLPTLRFDYFGTGESDGDDLDGDLTRWQSDIKLAHHELLARQPGAQVAWVGARLGGTLALLASQRLAQPLHKLIVWEPTVDGPSYLKALAEAHVAAVSSPFRPSVAPAGQVPAGEALGFAMSATLIGQVAALQAEALAVGKADQVAIMAQPGDPQLSAWAQGLQRQHPGSQLVPLSVPFDWTSFEALNTALVPPAALQLLLQLLEARRA